MNYCRTCGECGCDINYPIDKLYRLEEWPAIDAFEEEFCSRECMMRYIMCSFCSYEEKVNDMECRCTFPDNDKGKCAFDEFMLKKELLDKKKKKKKGGK